MTDPFANGPILNVRKPSREAAALSRRLLRAGMTAVEQHVITEAQSVVALQRLGVRCGFAIGEDLARHALAEWKATSDAAIAAYPILADALAADVRKAEANGDLPTIEQLEGR